LGIQPDAEFPSELSLKESRLTGLSIHSVVIWSLF
jgi:hypothetical protein